MTQLEKHNPAGLTAQFPNPEDSPAPAWWPSLLYDLHFPKIHFPGPGPINLPAEVSKLLANLHIHTFSYYVGDERVAQQIRTIAEGQMIKSVHALGGTAEAKTKLQTAG